jgi:hypothetical protein
MEWSNIKPANTDNIVSVGNNSIGPYYWVGHCMNGIEYYAGQTFTCTTNGTLKRIKLYPSIVFGETDARLSLYAFDGGSHAWKEVKAEVKQHVNKSMEGHWISFELPAVPVEKGSKLGFKLSCNSGGMLAIAECPWSTFNPYPDGEEWIGSSEAMEGNFHKDFDLAFEAQIETR